MKKVVAAISLMVVFAAAVPVAAAVPYQLTNLGGVGACAYGISSNKLVAGSALDPVPWKQYPFIWDATNGFRSLNVAHVTTTRAAAVNSASVVVGNTYDFSYNYHGFVYDEVHGMRNLGTPDNTWSGNWSDATGINNSGLIAGYASKLSGSITVAVTWDTDLAVRELPTLGGTTSRANGINENGLIVGYSKVTTGAERACTWDANRDIHALPLLAGSTVSMATAVSQNGWIVGITFVGGKQRACVWDPTGACSQLGLFGTESRAYGVNNSGTVVGIYKNSAGAERPFAWTAAEGMVDLGTLAGTPNSSGNAYAIDNDGWIVGTSYYSGQTVATLWKPLPEPSSLLVLLSGVGGLGSLLALRRRRA